MARAATIKIAGPFMQAFLYTFGFAGVYTPAGIYLLPECYGDVGLRAHELCHEHQRYRDGFCVFWCCVFWYLLRYGYRNSPYEIEARAAAIKAVGFFEAGRIMRQARRAG